MKPPPKDRIKKPNPKNDREKERGQKPREVPIMMRTVDMRRPSPAQPEAFCGEGAGATSVLGDPSSAATAAALPALSSGGAMAVGTLNPLFPLCRPKALLVRWSNAIVLRSWLAGVLMRPASCLLRKNAESDREGRAVAAAVSIIH